MKPHPAFLFLAAALLAGCVTTPPAPSSPPPVAVDSREVSPAQPVIPERSFNLKDFGADGTTVNTAAFKKAIAAVNAAGGGTLVVPGGIFFTGPFDLCSGINLHLDPGATIWFSPKPEDYRSGGRGYRPELLGANLHDVMISGTGTINGHGESWWVEARRFKNEANAKKLRGNTSPRPRMVVFENCQRVRVEGVTLTNSPVFNLVPSHCQDVTVEGVTIYNPANSPNTDGIDPSICQRVLIAHCHIDTGDDCIAIKSGGRTGGATVENILITDCAFFHGHGCSFGSETSAGDRHVTIRRCTFDGTEYGVRLKSDRTRGGLAEDILYTDLTMKNVGQAIEITSYYPARETPEPGQKVAAQPVTATTPTWRNVTIRNVTATNCTIGAGYILGLPESPASDIKLENVSLEGPVGLRLGYVKGIALHHVTITPKGGPPLMVEDTVTGLTQQ